MQECREVICLVAGVVERLIELARLEGLAKRIDEERHYRSKGKGGGKGPPGLKRAMTSMARYVDPSGERMFSPEKNPARSTAVGCRIITRDDGELEVDTGALGCHKPKAPACWESGEMPMQLTVAYSLGNGTSQVVLPSDELTVWHALQQVKSTIIQHNPKQGLKLLRSNGKKRLKFTVMDTPADGSNCIAQPALDEFGSFYNTSTEGAPAKGAPAEGGAAPEEGAASVYHIPEHEHALAPQDFSGRPHTCDICNIRIASTETKLSYRCVQGCDFDVCTDCIAAEKDEPLSPSNMSVHHVSGGAKHIGELEDMTNQAKQAVILIEILHQELFGSTPLSDFAWQNAKLNSLLETQLDDNLSILAGSLPSWCTLLTR